MRKGNIVIIEGSNDEVKLLRAIGRKDKGGQFWEVEFENGEKDIRLLKEQEVQDKNKEGT
jgi:hypothetical protein